MRRSRAKAATRAFIAGGQSLRADALDAAGAAEGRRRHHAAAGARATSASSGNAIRVGCGVRQARIAGLARACKSASRCSPPRCPGSGMRRRAAAARCAARSRMPIRARNCRWYWSRSAARSICRRSGSGARSQRPSSSPASCRPRARRRTDRGRAVSLPQHGTGFASANSARRHGDFAIVACAAMCDGQTRAARHRRRRRPAGGCATCDARRRALDDALDAFAWDLEARDDLHATAALSPRARAPHRARRPSRRRADAAPERRRAHRVRLTLNGRACRSRRRAAHAADRLPAPCARPHRHACRLRARRLRRLHDRRSTARPRARASRSPCRPTARTFAPSKGLRPRRAAFRCCRRRSGGITRCNAASARRAS